jgi:hypothetical protein
MIFRIVQWTSGGVARQCVCAITPAPTWNSWVSTPTASADQLIDTQARLCLAAEET